MVDAGTYYLVAALERGDLDAAWARAARMPRQAVGLEHALGLVALMALNSSADRSEAAASRWIDRARQERPDLPLERLRRLVNWLPDLAAVTDLQTVCEQESWPVALATLDHLLPSAR